MNKTRSMTERVTLRRPQTCTKIAWRQLRGRDSRDDAPSRIRSVACYPARGCGTALCPRGPRARSTIPWLWHRDAASGQRAVDTPWLHVRLGEQYGVWPSTETVTAANWFVADS
jgi:hypothetical protein